MSEWGARSNEQQIPAQERFGNCARFGVQQPPRLHAVDAVFGLGHLQPPGQVMGN